MALQATTIQLKDWDNYLDELLGCWLFADVCLEKMQSY